MEKELIRELFSPVFEQELLEEVIQYPVLTVNCKMKLDDKGVASISHIPLVVKGSMRAIEYDEDGEEVLIYNINPGQSCILSITYAKNNKVPAFSGRINEESSVLLIPKDIANQWFGKYSSWRDFTISLYDHRLSELLSQHKTVKQQTKKIEKQSRQITDSIHYAKRIQSAALPPAEYMESLLPEHFIYYVPRDIVSGDYYWMTRIENKTIVVVADCTGHGVPGAFMSMLGISLLNQLVTDKALKPANEILNNLRDNVKRSLWQTGKNDETKDGMDLALIVFDFDTHKLEYAGAYNPLIFIRNNQLTEIKADRMPIGVFLKDDKDFTRHEHDFNKGDVIYAFSDGFADQVGGEQKRKFMSRKFKDLLFEIHQKPMIVQKQILEETFETWMGNNEQVDDILVFGIRI